ncbi:hypothetical protein [Luteimonas deserti]|uniref:C-type lysozyme inhibitor domain-containing protein n=1 Tax=Luteimonas deserti TaxID=2752306 RepID=A0A7Z0QPU4_9GAMM|nr:hypothetical protein [Luteimonas deserti]NYZ62503.1 hypothetical protein [Luteimonas deserti]
MRSTIILAMAIAAFWLTACAEPAPPPEPAPRGPAVPASPPDPDPETVSARYDCPGVGEIDIVREARLARVRMIDGRTVHLGAIQGSRPPIWSEVGLGFTVDGDFVELTHASGRTIACKELAGATREG